MGTIKDRNGKDLTEREEIKKRWQKYTKNYTKKILNDQDNHDGVVTNLEPDILNKLKDIYKTQSKLYEKK